MNKYSINFKLHGSLSSEAVHEAVKCTFSHLKESECLLHGTMCAAGKHLEVSMEARLDKEAEDVATLLELLLNVPGHTCCLLAITLVSGVKYD